MSDAGLCRLILVVAAAVTLFLLYAAVCVAADGDDRAGDR
jgi:hypothetical protein